MTDPALLQSLSRLDQAIACAEAAADALLARRDAPGANDDRVRQALAELDGIIASLREPARG